MRNKGLFRSLLFGWKFEEINGWGVAIFFSELSQKRVEEVLIRLSCEFEPDRGNGLEVRAIFRRECPKSTWHFRVLGTWQTMHFFAYWMLIGPNYFATNMTSRFQRTRDNQFRVSVWPTRDSKSAFFRADGHFFSENFETFQIFGICLTR